MHPIRPKRPIRHRRAYKGHVSRVVAWISSIAIMAGHIAPVSAQAVDITTGVGTGTRIVQSGAGSATVTTTNIQGSTAFNQFDNFNIGTGQTANVIQPGGTAALVNIINGGGSTIDGTLNAQIAGVGGVEVGGNHYYVNRDGFVVGAGGTVNAGALTMTTPTSDYQDRLINEANGGTSVTATLFAGTDPLNPAASIDVFGTINARRLDLRSGAWMLVDGTISVQDSSGTATGKLTPAVNSDGYAQAAGISVEGGVVRLLSQGEMALRGNVKARRKTTGGVVAARAEGPLIAGGTIDVAAAPGADNDSGSVILFTRKTAVLETALKIEATSTGGSGGLVSIAAQDAITMQGRLATGAATRDTRGSTVLRAPNITLDGNVTTEGGDLMLLADPATASDAAGAIAGDFVAQGQHVSVLPGAQITAQADNGTDQDGLIALLAVDFDEIAAIFVETDDVGASVRIDGAVLTGGAVLVKAVAATSTSIGSEYDDGAALADLATVGGANNISAELLLDLGKVSDQIGQLLDRSNTEIEDQLTALQGLFELNLTQATALIDITGSTLTAMGAWQEAPITDPADRLSGHFSANGQQRELWRFADDNPLSDVISLPVEFAGSDGVGQGLYVHSHATNRYSLGGFGLVLGVAIAITKTDSRVRVDRSGLLSDSDINLPSTVFEDHSIKITPIGFADVAFGIEVAVRDLTNQTLITDSVVNAQAGDLAIGALTGVNHAQEVFADAKETGKFSLAINIGISNALTEAAVGNGGSLGASGDLSLDAQTSYFQKRSVTEARLGLVNVETPSILFRNKTDELKAQALAFKDKIIKPKLGPEEEPKPSVGVSLALDIQIDDADTRATLGGLVALQADPEAGLAQLGAVTASTLTGNLSVKAAKTFVAVANGGKGITRRTTAQAPKLTFVRKKIAQAAGVSEEKLSSDFDKVAMVATSVGLMAGETVAEIGSNATTNSGSLTVDARNIYPLFTSVEQVKSGVLDILAGAGNVFVPDQFGQDKPADQALFDVVGGVDPRSFATSYTQSRAIAASPGTATEEENDEEQGFALALSMNAFNSDDTAVAAIRAGADVTVGPSAIVQAITEGDFIHLVNLPADIPGKEDPVSDAIGGAISFGRVASTTSAIVEDDASVHTDGTVLIDAETNINQSLFTYAGGGGNNRLINGALALGISEGTTTARIGGAAKRSGGLVTLSALDDSMLLNIGGALSASENLSVGATGVVNFSDRDVYAGVGPGPGDDASVTGTSGAVAVDVGTLSIIATNNSADISIAVAGVKTTASDYQDAALADFLLSDDEFAKLLTEDDKEAPGDGDPQADAGAGKPRTGLAVAGAAALNLSLGNETRAEINTPATITASGAVTVNALNTSTSAAATGAVAVGLSSRQDVDALAGSFLILMDTRNVTARIARAELRTGSLALDATDDATVVNIAIGGAGNKRGSKAIAGSVAVATILGSTSAEVEDSVLVINGEAKLAATDTSLTVSIAGAAGLNFSKSSSSATGAGIGLAVNTVKRPARVVLDNDSFADVLTFVARASTDDSIYAFAISAGLGKTAFAGSITVNTVIGGAQTEIGTRGAEDAELALTADSVTVSATESADIFAAGGALALPKTGGNALDGAVVINTIKNASHARLEDTVLRHATSAAVLTPTVDVTATADSEIRAYTVAAGVSSQKFAAALGASSNVIDSTVNVSLARSLRFEGGDVTLTATNNRFIQSLSGGVGIAGKGAGDAALALNLMLGNDAKIDLANAEMLGSGAIVANAFTTSEIQLLAAGLAVGQKTTIGISAAANVTTGTTGVVASGAILSTDDTLALTAVDTSAIKALSGGAALSLGGSGAGAAISINVIGTTTSVSADGGRFFADGTAAFTADSTATIDALAVGLTLANNNALAGSIVVGDIGATTKVDLTPSELDIDGAITVRAKQTNDMDLLTGAAAIGNDNTVGAALTVALIHGATTADVVTGTLPGEGAVSVTAEDTGTIDAKALAGAVSLRNGGAASLVIAKIGTRPDGPDPELEGDQPGDAKPIAAATRAGTEAQDGAVTAALNAIKQSSAPDAEDVVIAPETPRDDTLRARLKITGGEIDNQGFRVIADRNATINSVGVASLTLKSAAGLGLNFLYGATTAELLLPVTIGAATHTTRGLLVRASENDTIDGIAIAGAAGGDNGGAGGLVFNDINRVTDVKVASTVAGQRAAVRMPVRQADIGHFANRIQDATAGVIGAGGKVGVGAAIAVNRNADTMQTTVADLAIDERKREASGDVVAAPPGDGLFFSIAGQNQVDQDAVALSLGGAGKLGVAGSFGINLLEGSSKMLVSNVDAEAEGFTGQGRSGHR